MNLAYTWSKNLSDNQTDRSTAPQNSYDTAVDWGRAALDRRHILTGNWVYDLPFFNDSNGIVKTLLGGWQFQGIATYQTGLPLTVTTSNFDPAGLGLIPALIAGSRPNISATGTRMLPIHSSSGLTPPATNLTRPQRQNVNVPTIVGTTGRGTIFGPSTRRVDFVLAKTFQFTESMSLQLRGESYNVFNWTNFTTVSTNVTSDQLRSGDGYTRSADVPVRHQVLLVISREPTLARDVQKRRGLFSFEPSVTEY